MSTITNTKVAIVTGANKGIGYAVVKGLCKKFDGVIYLTSRNTAKGQEAVKELKKLGCNPTFHQLDVNDQDSVNRFKDHIKNTYGGVDILVNNAGIIFKDHIKNTYGGVDILVNNAGIMYTETPENYNNFLTQAQETIATDYFGLLRVSEAFIPLLRKDARIVNVSSSAGHLSRLPSARIVNVSSSAGHLSRLPSTDLRSKFSSNTLTVSQLTELVNQYLKAVKNKTNKEDGWGERSYSIAKIAVSALTRVHQIYFNTEKAEMNIFVNSVHPGYVLTDLNPTGDWSIDEGAKPILYLAVGENNHKGLYIWKDCSVVDWLGETTPQRH
ncbi:short chain dehydrogenase [Popillia japonica]|uniref:Short chain dehydrogenase n=1 Tax=Popillia japonica TaxID=7064 RepID=A0AAW1KIL0_POPJA